MGVAVPSSQLAPGVDIKGDGGMVIAPPSIKPGVGQYQWLNDKPVAEAPAWLIEAASKQKEAKKPSSRATSSGRSCTAFIIDDLTFLSSAMDISLCPFSIP